ncbi:MAG: hypothetical protein H6Q04_1359 [Acidobacteria bacterium]|jgi:hypothetical protein|nr:hypothetical protein [Acidobacteriota bacterium]
MTREKPIESRWVGYIQLRMRQRSTLHLPAGMCFKLVSAIKALKARYNKAQGGGREAAATLGIEWFHIKPCKGDAGFMFDDFQTHLSA